MIHDGIYSSVCFLSFSSLVRNCSFKLTNLWAFSLCVLYISPRSSFNSLIRRSKSTTRCEVLLYKVNVMFERHFWLIYPAFPVFVPSFWANSKILFLFSSSMFCCNSRLSVQFVSQVHFSYCAPYSLATMIPWNLYSCWLRLFNLWNNTSLKVIVKMEIQAKKGRLEFL